jgi:hypothetical protein
MVVTSMLHFFISCRIMGMVPLAPISSSTFFFRDRDFRFSADFVFQCHLLLCHSGLS